MVIISTPLSTIPAATGVAGMAAAGLRGLPVRLPVAGMVSLMAGAGAGMAVAVATPVVETGSPGNREARRQRIGAALHLIVADPHRTAGEDSVKVILTV